MKTVAKRYAKAALEAAIEASGKSAIEPFLAGLDAIKATLTQSTELSQVCHHPVFRSERCHVLSQLFKKLDVPVEVQHLLLLLSDKERLALLDDVIDAAYELGDAALGRLRAHVTTASPLTAQQKERLQKALSARFGQPVVLNISMNERLLGGMVCQIGDITLDNSVSRQLSVFTERLLA